MNIIKNLCWLSILLLSMACGDDEVPEPGIEPVGDCHYLFDVNGQGIGVLGACGGQDHWQESLLLSQELEWLAFQDSIVFTDDFVQLSLIQINAFPIPAEVNGQLFIDIRGNGDIGAMSKLKAIIIDENETILLNFAQPISAGTNDLAITLDGLPAGRSYRLYYSLANSALSIYYQGYGDFFICEDPNDYTNCL